MPACGPNSSDLAYILRVYRSRRDIKARCSVLFVQHRNPLRLPKHSYRCSHGDVILHLRKNMHTHIVSTALGEETFRRLIHNISSPSSPTPSSKNGG